MIQCASFYAKLQMRKRLCERSSCGRRVHLHFDKILLSSLKSTSILQHLWNLFTKVSVILVRRCRQSVLPPILIGRLPVFQSQLPRLSKTVVHSRNLNSRRTKMTERKRYDFWSYAPRTELHLPVDVAPSILQYEDGKEQPCTLFTCLVGWKERPCHAIATWARSKLESFWHFLKVLYKHRVSYVCFMS